MDRKIPVTAVVLTKNEELVIERTLRSLSHFDQVIVVDSHSADETRAISIACGAEVVDFSWNRHYPKKKQWSLQHDTVRNDWVLFVDADEYPTPELVRSISTEMANSRCEHYGAYDLKLRYSFAGRSLKHGHRVVKRALVHRHRSRFPEVDDLNVSTMWEVEGHYQPIVQGAVGALAGNLCHEDVDPLYDYFSRHNRYSDWEAHLLVNKTLQRQVRGVRSAGGRLFDRVPFKPIAFFLYSYLVRCGFLDGRPGFDYAVALSFYYWQIELKRRELQRANASSPQ